MYAKIFESIYDGSLRKDWRALVTFQQLLVLCDEEGFIDKTPDAISARTTIPIEIIQAGITELASPDPESRSQEEEGRRIVLINPARKWGWRIVNYTNYREIRSKEDLRDYWKNQKRQQRQEASSDRFTELKQKLCVAFRRRHTDPWSYAEEFALSDVAKRENCIGEFTELINFRAKRGKYFPQSVIRLLEGWVQTLDASRNGHSLIESPTVLMRAIDEEISVHPANHESVRFNSSCSQNQKEDLKQLRKKRDEIRSQIAHA